MPATLDGLLIPIKIDLSGLTSGAASAKSSITGIAEVAQQATSTFQGMSGSANMGKVITGTDVAQAQLTLMESKVTEARAKLQTLQNAANAGQAVTGIPEAEANLTLLEAKAQETRQNLQQLETPPNTGGFLSGIGDMVGGLGGLISQAGMVVFGFQQIASVATSVAQSLLAPAASAEQVESSLEVFTGSANKAKQAMSDLATFASHTPFETQTIDNVALKLMSVGISAKDTIPDLLALGDGLDAVGRTSSADLSQLADAFVKIQTQGHLTSETMDSFASMGIDAWSVLEKQTGKTHEALQAMISAGLYPAKQAMQDLTTGIEANPLYKGQMANDANVFNGALSTLKSNWNQILAGFGSPILKGLEPILGNLSTMLASPAFQQFASSIGQGIVSVFTTIGTTIKNDVGPAWDKFDKEVLHDEAGGIFLGIFTNIGIILKNVGDIVKQISPSFMAFTELFKNVDVKSALVQAVSDLETAIYIVSDKVQTATNNIQAFSDWLNKASLPAQVFKDLLIGIGAAFAAFNIASFLLTVPALVVGFLSWAAAAGAAAVATIAATWPILAIGAGIAIVVAGIILAIQNWGTISAWLQSVWSGVVAFFQGIWTKITGFFSGVGQWFKDRFNEASTGVLSAWSAVTNFFSSIGQWFHDRFSEAAASISAAWSGVTGFFSGIWKGIQNTFSGIGNWFHDRFSDASDGAQSGWQKTQNFFGGIGSWFQSKGTDASKAWGTGMGQIGQVNQDAMNKVVGGFNWLYNHNYYFKDAVDGIKKWNKDATDWLVNTWTAITTWFATTWQKIATFATTSWNTIYTTVSSWITQTVAWITDQWTTITGWLSAQWKKISDFAATSWNTIYTTISGWITQAVSWITDKWNAITGWLSAQWQMISGYATIYWNMIYVTVSDWITQVVAWITDKWTAITGWLQAQWNIISGFAVTAWNAIYTTISGWISKVVVWITDQWTTASNWIQTQWNKLATFADSAWQGVSKVFSGIWSQYVSGPLGSLWTSISNWWNGVVNNAKSFGTNFMNAIAGSISSASGAVGNALHSAIAAALANLGFHDIPGWVGHASGILNSPIGHFATVGERGPELMFVPQGASIFPNGTFSSSASTPDTSYPIQPSPMGVASAAAPAVAASADGGTSHTFILEFDGRQFVNQVVGPNLGKTVRLKLGAKGWTS